MRGPHPFPERPFDIKAVQRLLTELRSLEVRMTEAGAIGAAFHLTMAIGTARNELAKAEAAVRWGGVPDASG